MTTGPLVSAVIIFLNAERYLEEAIHSVFAQTYPHWELLLVDDGSTDRSTAIAQRWAQRHPTRVRCLEHPGHENKGMSASRNLGLAHARGEYIAPLDADDVWLPHKLAHQVAVLQGNPDAALALNPVEDWYPEEDRRRSRRMTLTPGSHPPGEWPLRIAETGRDATPPCGVLIRMDALVAVGGWDDSFRSLSEDRVVWYKIGLSAPIYFDPLTVALYRQHGGSSQLPRSLAETAMTIWQFYTWLEAYMSRSHPGQFTAVLSAERALALEYQTRVFSTMVRRLIEAERFAEAYALAYCLEQPMDLSRSGEWHYLTAFALHQTEPEHPQALERYALALAHGFDEFWVRYNRGALHAHLGHPELAQADLLRAVELRPDHEGVRESLRQLPDGSGGDRR